MAVRDSARFRDRVDWSSLLSFSLVAVVVGGMMYTLTQVVRGFDLEFIWPVALIAIVWGGIFGNLKTRGWLTALLTVLAGLVLLFLMVGRLGDEILRFGNEVALYVLTLFEKDAQPSLEALREVSTQIGESFTLMFTLLLRWFQNLPKPGYDPISVVLVWGLGVWLCGVWASWFLLRRLPLVGALPAILLAAFASTISGRSVNSLLVILGATLALMVLVSLKAEELEWIRRKVEASIQIRNNALWASLGLSVVLVIIAAAFSTVDLGELLDRIREARSAPAASSRVGSSGTPRPVIDSEAVAQFGQLTRGGLPRVHLIGSGPELSERVVMRVKITDSGAEAETGAPLVSPIYYFRALSYDEYTGKGWTTGGGKIYSYRAGEAAIGSYSPNQQLIEQSVEYIDSAEAGGVAHAVGELASASVDYEVAWRVRTAEGELADQFGVSLKEDGYSAFSLTPSYSSAELRAASNDYPDWVAQRYLQLPEDISARVRELAVKLTLNAATPYDKALAIESYLRGFDYTLDLGAPPASLELADYFLFTLQQGYCDYFATTMVVLARTVGLPARFATGYIGERYDPETEEYVVTADLAHSWAEVYFPGYGWVTFEPTSGRPPLNRPEVRQMPAIAEEEAAPPASPNRVLSFLSQVPSLIGIGLFVIGLALFAIPYLDELTLRRSGSRAVFASIYRRLQEFGERLGAPASPGDTPFEFSGRFTTHIRQLIEQGQAVLAAAPEDVNWLVEKCVQAAYSSSPPRLYERSQAIHLWARLRWRLAAAVGYQKLPWVKRRFRRVSQP